MTDSKPYLSDVPPTYMGNLIKMIPLFREFNGQKPTHMGGTYPYQQYVMNPLPLRVELSSPPSKSIKAKGSWIKRHILTTEQNNIPEKLPPSSYKASHIMDHVPRMLFSF